MTPAAGVDIQSPNSAELARRLQRWGQSLEDPRPAFDRVVRRLNQSEEQVFATDGNAIGHAWPAAVEPDRKINSQLLVATGALRASLVGQTGESIRMTGSTELRFGTTVPYAHFHEYGAPGHSLPARPMIGMTDQVRQAIANEIHSYSAEAIQ